MTTTYYTAVRTPDGGMLIAQKERGQTSTTILIDPLDVEEVYLRITAALPAGQRAAVLRRFAQAPSNGSSN